MVQASRRVAFMHKQLELSGRRDLIMRNIRNREEKNKKMHTAAALAGLVVGGASIALLLRKWMKKQNKKHKK